MSTLYLKQLPVGPMQNFVYLVGDRESHEAIAVDPAWDIDGILNVLAADEMALTGALITHYHPDHIGGDLMGHHIQGPVELLERGQKIKITINKAEADYVPHVCGLSRSDLSLCESGDEIAVGAQRIRLLHTPGHTPGHQSLLVKLPKTGALVLSGDAVHFQANWDNRRVPSNNVDQEQTKASMERIAGILVKEKATLWINHDKAQRDTLTMAPGFYE